MKVEITSDVQVTRRNDSLLKKGGKFCEKYFNSHAILAWGWGAINTNKVDVSLKTWNLKFHMPRRQESFVLRWFGLQACTQKNSNTTSYSATPGVMMKGVAWREDIANLMQATIPRPEQGLGEDNTYYKSLLVTKSLIYSALASLPSYCTFKKLTDGCLGRLIGAHWSLIKTVGGLPGKTQEVDHGSLKIGIGCEQTSLKDQPWSALVRLAMSCETMNTRKSGWWPWGKGWQQAAQSHWALQSHQQCQIGWCQRDQISNKRVSMTELGDCCDQKHRCLTWLQEQPLHSALTISL